MIFILVIVFGVSSNNYIQQVVGIRPLLIREGYASAAVLMEIQSLQRGPVPPSGGSPCTYIPGRNKGRCTLADPGNQIGVAPPPPAFLELNDGDLPKGSL